MKNIGAEWRNLADGLLRVDTLAARFRAEWGTRLEMARREREEARRRGGRRLRRIALGFVIALALLLLIMSVVLGLPPADAAATGLFIAAPAVAVLYGLGMYLDVPDPVPELPDLSERWWGTVSGRSSSVRRSGPALSARHYGDAGEEAFISYLAGRLSDGYLAVRGLLVVPNLDADLVLVGPTGI